MSTVKVYQAKDFRKSSYWIVVSDITEKPKFPEDFELVAEVLTEELNEAYELTNSVRSNWFENKNGMKIKVYKTLCRSTSVGDVMEKEGVLYYVDNFGFEKF